MSEYDIISMFTFIDDIVCSILIFKNISIKISSVNRANVIAHHPYLDNIISNIEGRKIFNIY